MNIAVLISGTGRTLRNFVSLGNKLRAEIKIVIGSSPKATGLKYAPKDGIITDDPDVIFKCCEQIDLICMAGWVKFLPMPDNWTNRVMNIHPALLPAFGGKGMYGRHVHQAVIDSGAKFSGCTVHFANNEYDHGPIILQRVVPVLDNDTAETLAVKVFEEEKIAYPEAINLFSRSRLEVDGFRVRKR